MSVPRPAVLAVYTGVYTGVYRGVYAVEGVLSGVIAVPDTCIRKETPLLRRYAPLHAVIHRYMPLCTVRHQSPGTVRHQSPGTVRFKPLRLRFLRYLCFTRFQCFTCFYGFYMRKRPEQALQVPKSVVATLLSVTPFSLHRLRKTAFTPFLHFYVKPFTRKGGFTSFYTGS